MQETLGRLHDIEVLTRLIHEMPLPASPLPRWVTHVDDLRYRLEAECRRLHSEFIGQRRQLTQTVAAAVETATRIWSRPASGGSDPRRKMTLADVVAEPGAAARRVASDR